MNDSELFGRTLRVNLAKPMKIKEGSSRPVWASDEWLQKYAGTKSSYGGNLVTTIVIIGKRILIQTHNIVFAGMVVPTIGTVPVTNLLAVVDPDPIRNYLQDPDAE